MLSNYWDEKEEKEGARSTDKYKPNPDYDKLEDGECPKCVD